ncbi:MAG: hypothetical protein JSW25_01425 [Thermoplasmata archaeon]|nr:MAG: hypothetical protein JSW25_01425 [Thermoplasmata archaeon]
MPLMVPPEDDELEDEQVQPMDPEDISSVEDDDTGLDLMVPGVDEGVDGVDASLRERAEAGLQDTLDLTDWKMPSLRDYFWYLFVYTILIALAVQVIYNYRMLWAYVLWGGYLATMLVLATLILRSMNYRRGTYSKSFQMSTLELQQAIDDATEDAGLKLDHMEQPEDVFLRPMIAVYHMKDVEFTVNLEGRAHLKRKVVRVGRFPKGRDLDLGHRFINALDFQAEAVCKQRKTRTLFRQDGSY